MQVALSKIRPGKQNPRRVKPKPEALQRLVASIRAFGLLEPLVVRPIPDTDGEYQIIAGSRRLSALRQIHRNSKEDPKISCEVRRVDDAVAGAMSLAENFPREAMHPLDEAEAFAGLAADEAKGVDAIAADFGVSDRYVRQRMKLAGLADVVKTAFRQDQIDTATAEAFSAVPEDRQLAIWQETGGNPRHAQHVRNIIAAAWIDAKHALFDLSTVSESAVSRDLFSDQILIERSAFMEAQSQALAKQQEELREEGWKDVVTAPRDEIQDRLYAMRAPDREYDATTSRKLSRLQERRDKLEAKANQLDGNDEAAIQKLSEKIESLDTAAQQVVEEAPVAFSEETKAVGTVILTLDPDGQVRREYRVPRPQGRPLSHGDGSASDSGSNGQPQPPTSDDLSDRQLADTFSHQVLAVREAVLKSPAVRKRILVMILHEKMRSEALAIRHDPNAITVHVANSEKFVSPPWQRLTEKRSELDPFVNEHFVDDHAGYRQLSELPDTQIARLIDLLVVEKLTAHLQRETDLIKILAAELQVNVRKEWYPDSAWLTGYQKIQLAQLMAELRGPMYDPSRESRKKSELVEALAKLFSEAKDGQLEDNELAVRVNTWLPSNLREQDPEPAEADPSH